MKNILVLFILSVGTFQTLYADGQTSSANNILSKSITSHSIPTGLSVMGVFEGRPPCNEIAKQLGFPVRPECTKIKWRLTLFQDSITHQPTTYKFLGSYMPPEGNWEIVKGAKSNPGAIVYQLHLGKPGASFYLLKGDDNVLFVLDENREFRTGNDKFSYTLNRVELIAKK
jgi:hypothetical protein